MTLFRWLRRLAFGNHPPRSPRPERPRRSRCDWVVPRLEALEDRLAPATTITVVVGGISSGTLDGFLSPTDGTITAADGGAAPGSVSTGALLAVNATTDISVTAQTSIVFNDLGGTLTLQTGAANRVTFSTTAAITFANAANTLATSGASLTFNAGGNASLANLNAAGGAITLAATDLNLAGTVNSGAAVTTLANSVAGTPIDLGTNTAGSIGLTQGEL